MIRAAALLLTVLTGFSGLVYEVTWQKCLATLLGSHAEATAAVLGIYLGGLSLGYALFGAVVRRVVARAARRGPAPRLLPLYGAVEAGIGVWALLFPWLFAGVQGLSARLALGPDLLAFSLDVVLTVLLIGPPTVLMGGTIPILTQALSRGLEDATRFHAFVYGFNTAGAFGGALAAAFVLIPALGIHATLAWMGALNIAAGASFALLGLRGRGAATGVPPSTPTAAPEGFAVYAAASLLLGFAMMSVQTVLIRIGALALGASHFTFATVVAVFVLCIALGSLLVSAFDRIPRAAVVAAPALLATLLLGLYFALPDATYWAHVLRSVFSSEPAAFHPFHLAVFLCVLAVLAAPVGLSGASLPLLFHHLRREVGHLGSVAGRLYSWNTVGSLLGALLGGYALLFWLDLHQVYRLAVGAAALATLLLGVRVLGASAPLAALAAVPVAYGLAVLPAWPQERLSAGLFRTRSATPHSYLGPDAFFRRDDKSTIVFQTDDPVSTVTVRELELAGRLERSIMNNGKSDGSLVADYPTMALVALLPCLLKETCESAFVIGYGTGVTVGEFAALETTQRVDVAEISRGVIDAAVYFDHGSLGASKHPKVRIFRSDAYRALLRSDTEYDVIASEPSHPWVTGVENLFSREFLEAARGRLRPGGIYAQWFHTYEMDTATMRLVLRTYAEVFDHVTVWYALGHDLLLLGFAGEPDLQVSRIEQRLGRADLAAGMKRAGIRSFPGLLAHELLPLGVLHAADLGDEVHTLFHPLLSDRAARAFFAGRSGQLPFTGGEEPARVGAAASLLGRWLAQNADELPEAGLAEIAEQLCSSNRPRECAAFLAWWRVQSSGFEAAEEQRLRWRRLPGLEDLLSDERLTALAALYGAGVEGSIETAEARRISELFEEHYHHAIPFRREALRDTWSRCRGAGCMSARMRAQERLGRI